MRLLPEIVTASAASLRTDGGHLFWKEEPSAGLAESLAEHGQLCPVLAEQTPDGLNLLAGYSRVAALAQAAEPVLVRLVEEADDPGRGLLYLADNGQRALTDGMRLAALDYFAAHRDRAALEADVLPRLGVRPGSKNVRLLLAWLDLDSEWRTHLAAGRAPLEAAEPLSRMDVESRAALSPFFAALSWSRSHGVNFLTWLFEAARREGTTPAALVAEHGLAEVLDEVAGGLSPKDGLARLATLARRIHRPALTRLQARYTEAARAIGAGTSWRIEEPSNFETGGAALTVNLRTPAQLQKAVADLARLAEAPEWAILWNPGQDDEDGEDG